MSKFAKIIRIHDIANPNIAGVPKSKMTNNTEVKRWTAEKA